MGSEEVDIESVGNFLGKDWLWREVEGGVVFGGGCGLGEDFLKYER